MTARPSSSMSRSAKETLSSVRVAEAARERGATRYYWHTQEDNARARVLYDKVARFNGFIRYVYPL